MFVDSCNRHLLVFSIATNIGTIKIRNSPNLNDPKGQLKMKTCKASSDFRLEEENNLYLYLLLECPIANDLHACRAQFRVRFGLIFNS